jgi:hypothetical protein
LAVLQEEKGFLAEIAEGAEIAEKVTGFAPG